MLRSFRMLREYNKPVNFGGPPSGIAPPVTADSLMHHSYRGGWHRRRK